MKQKPVDLDKLIKDYFAGKPLTKENCKRVLWETLRRDRERWQDIFAQGCSDPAWPDGCNLNLVRGQIIASLRCLQDLGEDVSRDYIPPEVDDTLMIPSGKYFRRRYEKFKQYRNRLELAGAEISLF